MVKNTTKRVMLTPAQQIAKAEADLAETKRKAYARLLKKYDTAVSSRDTLAARRDELSDIIEGREADIAYLESQIPKDVLDAYLSDDSETVEA